MLSVVQAATNSGVSKPSISQRSPKEDTVEPFVLIRDIII